MRQQRSSKRAQRTALPQSQMVRGAEEFYGFRRRIAAFWMEHWQWIIGTAVAILGALWGR